MHVLGLQLVLELDLGLELELRFCHNSTIVQ